MKKQYDDLLIKALEMYKEEQLNDTPKEDEISHEFSPEFEKKMDKLTKKQKRVYFNFFGKTFNRAAAIILVVFLSIGVSFNADAILEPIAKFTHRIFSTKTEVNYNTEKDKTEFTYYTLPSIPDEYNANVKRYIYPDSGADTVYYKNENEYIELSQMVTKSSAKFYSDNNTTVKREINDIEALICSNTEFIFCAWCEDNCFFLLIYPDYLGYEYADSVVGKLIEGQNSK